MEWPHWLACDRSGDGKMEEDSASHNANFYILNEWIHELKNYIEHMISFLRATSSLFIHPFICSFSLSSNMYWTSTRYIAAWWCTRIKGIWFLPSSGSNPWEKKEIPRVSLLFVILWLWICRKECQQQRMIRKFFSEGIEFEMGHEI